MAQVVNIHSQASLSPSEINKGKKNSDWCLLDSISIHTAYILIKFNVITDKSSENRAVQTSTKRTTGTEFTHFTFL